MKKRIADRLGISVLNPMQEATLALPVPARLRLLAPTGSGKTLAFAIPFLRSLPKDSEGLRGLIIAPTRELVIQTAEVLRVLAAPERKTVALYGGDINYTQADYTVPVALVMGAEDVGISPEVLKLCDGFVSIPMFGNISSLNVSVAAGIIMYEVVRQRINADLEVI